MIKGSESTRNMAVSTLTRRASISFPAAVYEELERLASAKKVSLAWVIREAAEKYVADQWPLFSANLEKERTAEGVFQKRRRSGRGSGEGI